MVLFRGLAVTSRLPPGANSCRCWTWSNWHYVVGTVREVAVPAAFCTVSSVSVSDGRAQRAAHRRAMTSDELVRAAAEVFAERGYHATRVSDIAEHAGVGQGTIYRHFADKRDMLDSVATTIMMRLLAAFQEQNEPERIDDFAEYKERAADIAVRVFALAAAEHRSIGFLLRELPSVDEQALATISTLQAGAHAVIERYYRVGIARGYLRADIDTGSAATAVLGLGLVGVWSIVRDPDNEAFRQHYSDTVIEFIVRHAVNPIQ